MKRGWINHPLFKDGQSFSKREAWIWMIERTAFSEYKTDCLGKKVKVDVGSFFASRSELSKHWNWSEQSVRTFLKRLEKEEMIEVKSNQGKTQIFLLNYATYQILQPDNQPQYKEINNNKVEINLKSDEKYAFFKDLLKSNYPSRNTNLDVSSTYRKLMTKIGKKTSCGKYHVSVDLFISACRNYKEECKRNKTDPQYVKCPKTFVNGAWENYLAADQKEESKPWTAFS